MLIITMLISITLALMLMIKLMLMLMLMLKVVLMLLRCERSWLRVIKERLTLGLKYLETRKKYYAKKHVESCK